LLAAPLTRSVSQVGGIRVWRKESPAIIRESLVQQTPVEKQPGTFRTGNQFEKPNLAQQISDSKLGGNA